MSRAEIYIEDADIEGGGIEFKINYVGGADTRSGAHQIVNMIRQHLDDTLRRIEADQHAAECSLVQIAGN